MNLEGRAAIRGIRRISRNRMRHGQRHVILVDNMSLCLALTKGRSSSKHMLHICRQTLALSIVTDCRFVFRWIASELNPADEPSRGLPLTTIVKTEKKILD